MKEFAQYLREARESRRISLQQVQDTTKIRLYHLEAIERGDFESIAASGPVYLRGFLRAYAAAVGLNQDEVMGRYEEACSGVQARMTPPEPTRAVSQPRKASVAPVLPRINLKAFGVPAVILAAAAVMLLVLSLSGGKGDIPARNNEKSAAPSQATANNPVSPESAGLTSVGLRAQSRCWAMVIVDGKEVYSGTLTPGESPVWSGRSIRIIVGNSGGVHLVVNGRDTGVAGNVGERKEFKFGDGA